MGDFRAESRRGPDEPGDHRAWKRGTWDKGATSKAEDLAGRDSTANWGHASIQPRSNNVTDYNTLKQWKNKPLNPAWPLIRGNRKKYVTPGDWQSHLLTQKIKGKEWPMHSSFPNQIHPQSNSGLAGFFLREECQLIKVKETELQTIIFQSQMKHGFGHNRQWTSHPTVVGDRAC